MKMCCHLRGYNRPLIAALARCNIDVYDESRMIRDSVRRYSKRMTMLGNESDLKRA